MSFLSSRAVRFVLAPLLSFWIAGAGCLLGCESMVALGGPSADESHPSDSNFTVVAEASCPSRKSQDCCQISADGQSVAGRTGGRSTVSRGSSHAPTPCPFAASRTAAITKAQESNKNISPLAVVASVSTQDSTEQTASLAPPLLLPNRGHTYLRCCVFLI